MLEAQEMFRTANKVTRPEKALILGFIAGSRGERWHGRKAVTEGLQTFCYYKQFTGYTGTDLDVGNSVSSVCRTRW